MDSILFGRNYRRGKVIQADTTSMDALLRSAAETLGFPHRDYRYRLLPIPKYLEEVGVRATTDPQNDVIFTLQPQHEAALFHEGVHYLMGKNGLLFSQQRIYPLYGTLVDETVAELATAQVYESDRSQTVTSMAQTLESMRRMTAQQFIEELKNNGLSQELSDFLDAIQIPDPSLVAELLIKQRQAEGKYAHTRNFKALEDDVIEIYKFLYRFEPRTVSLLLRQTGSLALENANTLLNNGINARILVSWIDAAVKKGMDSYQIYFGTIVCQFLNLGCPYAYLSETSEKPETSQDQSVLSPPIRFPPSPTQEVTTALGKLSRKPELTSSEIIYGFIATFSVANGVQVPPHLPEEKAKAMLDELVMELVPINTRSGVEEAIKRKIREYIPGWGTPKT